MGAEDIGIGSLGIYSGCLSPKKHFAEFGQGGREAFLY